MPRFLLILHDHAPSGEAPSPAQIQAIIAEYSDWARKLRESGTHLGGEKLTEGAGRILRGEEGGMSVMDGPFSESKELIGGFFMVQAPSYEAAIELCGDCPHLKYGAAIELREVEELEDHQG